MNTEVRMNALSVSPTLQEPWHIVDISLSWTGFFRHHHACSLQASASSIRPLAFFDARMKSESTLLLKVAYNKNKSLRLSIRQCTHTKGGTYIHREVPVSTCVSLCIGESGNINSERGEKGRSFSILGPASVENCYNPVPGRRR